MRLFRIWLRPGGGVKNDVSPECSRDNVIALGWNDIRLNLSKPITRENLREKVRRKYDSGYVADQFVCFFKTMQEVPRSIVLAPSPDGFCHIGEINGPVEWRHVKNDDYYCRPVRWTGQRLRAALSETLQKEIRDRHTCREIEDGRCKTEIARLIGSMEDDGQEEARSGASGRKPADLSSEVTSYEYLVKGGRRTAFRPHKEFQARLEDYLKKAGASDVSPELDFIDMRFTHGGRLYIGEVKVTNGYIRPRAAFRAALGQMLDYCFTRDWKSAPQMAIFLDQRVDAARLALAARLKVSVVVEEAPGVFRLANSYGDAALRSLFPPLT